MKRFVISIICGALLVLILSAVIRIPTNGPTFLDICVVLPFQLVAMAITKDRAFGEFVFYGLQVIVFSTVCYLFLAVGANLRSGGKQK